MEMDDGPDFEPTMARAWRVDERPGGEGNRVEEVANDGLWVLESAADELAP
jgi:hypothetical protein